MEEGSDRGRTTKRKIDITSKRALSHKSSLLGSGDTVRQVWERCQAAGVQFGAILARTLVRGGNEGRCQVSGVRYRVSGASSHKEADLSDLGIEARMIAHNRLRLGNGAVHVDRSKLVDSAAVFGKQMSGTPIADGVDGSARLAEDGDSLAFMEQEKEVVVRGSQVETEFAIHSQSLSNIGRSSCCASHLKSSSRRSAAVDALRALVKVVTRF